MTHLLSLNPDNIILIGLVVFLVVVIFLILDVRNSPIALDDCEIGWDLEVTSIETGRIEFRCIPGGEGIPKAICYLTPRSKQFHFEEVIRYVQFGKLYTVIRKTNGSLHLQDLQELSERRVEDLQIQAIA